MKLVIVESPAKAKTINKYLGSDYDVIASFGHIRELPSKNGSVEVENNFNMIYQYSDKGLQHIKEIEKRAKNADQILLATDPDREGEAISWHVIKSLEERKALKKNVSIKRVVFHEITKKAVQQAVAEPRELDMNLVNAQQARLGLDYLVGFNLSPVLWRKLPGSRSAGRVQSVAVRLIAERETEIENFISQDYWKIGIDFLNSQNAEFKSFLTIYKGKKLDKFTIKSQAEADEICAAVKPEKFHVADIEKKQSRRNPYPPFTTSSLQQEASRKLGFSAKKTMQIAQKLYEGIDIGGETIGLITYMRTDGVQLSNDAVEGTRKFIEAEYGKKYLPDAPRVYKTKAKNAQEAHEAIRPTHPEFLPKNMAKHLDRDQLELYELVWKRMIACQMESAILDQVNLTLSNEKGDNIARANGSTVAFDGFYKVYREDIDDKDDSEDDDNRILPKVEKGESLKLNNIKNTAHATEPLPRYTEASLVKKLEELGIGRPSTYASIISVIQDREYVRLDKKRFIPEEKGRIVAAFLTSFFNKYVQYDFTANLEEQLDQVSAGERVWTEMLSDFWNDFHENVELVMKIPMSEILENLNVTLESHLFPKDAEGKSNKKCTSCADGELSLKLGKFGAFLACSNYPECKYTKPIGTGGEGADGEMQQNFERQVLGSHPENGLAVILNKGPYGFYVQLGEGEGEEKPKRVGITNIANPDEVNLDLAVKILSLPREVGMHPETGKVIKAGVGRFGPYLYYESKFYSLPKTDDILTVAMNRAVTIIAEKNSKNSKALEPIKSLGNYPKTEKKIEIFDGRYGPYIKYEKINASIPKNTDIDSITIEDAIALIAIAKAKDKKPVKATKAKKAK